MTEEKRTVELKDEELEKVTGGSQPYSCPYCGVQFSTFDEFDNHVCDEMAPRAHID